MYRLNKYIIDNGVSNLNSIFKQYNSDTSNYTPFEELEFIQLSSFYKNRNQFKKSIAILKIYQNEFPNSIIPYNELLEIYEQTESHELFKVTENERQSLNEKLSNLESIEIQLLNPKTEDYEMSLQVRSGPGSEYELISLIEPAESYIVIGKSMNGEWLKLKRS